MYTLKSRGFPGFSVLFRHLSLVSRCYDNSFAFLGKDIQICTSKVNIYTWTKLRRFTLDKKAGNLASVRNIFRTTSKNYLCNLGNLLVVQCCFMSQQKCRDQKFKPLKF